MADDENVRPLRPVPHPDDDEPTDAERQRVDFGVTEALDLGLATFRGDGSDTLRLTWLGLNVAAVVAAMVDGAADQLIADGPPEARAALLGLQTTPERAYAILDLLTEHDRAIDARVRRLLGIIEGPDDD